MATVLATCQKASVKIGIAVPAAVYGSSTREHLELSQIANDAAEDILEQHDWQTLKTLHTITGDGATTEWALPTDFLRMPKDQRVWSSAQETPMTHVKSHDEWLELEVKSYELVTRCWTLLGGMLHTKPALATGETAKFYYQSRNYAVGTAEQEAFTDDADTFRLPDRVLQLGIVWRWRSAKGLNYAEEMTNYEIALAKAIDADKGPRMFAIGRATMPRDADIAYPQAITP